MFEREGKGEGGGERKKKSELHFTLHTYDTPSLSGKRDGSAAHVPLARSTRQKKREGEKPGEFANWPVLFLRRLPGHQAVRWRRKEGKKRPLLIAWPPPPRPGLRDRHRHSSLVGGGKKKRREEKRGGMLFASGRVRVQQVSSGTGEGKRGEEKKAPRTIACLSYHLGVLQKRKGGGKPTGHPLVAIYLSSPQGGKKEREERDERTSGGCGRVCGALPLKRGKKEGGGGRGVGEGVTRLIPAEPVSTPPRKKERGGKDG